VGKCACKGSFLDKLIQPTVLMLLYKEPMHGFSILKEMQTLNTIDYVDMDQSGLYRTLKKLEDAGLLSSEWDTDSGAQARRIYSITSAGRECLANWRGTLINYRNDIDKLANQITETLNNK
jgi:PadR family transcriptional regulator PadR